MRLGASPTYIGLKHKLAEKVRKVAQKNGYPVRALLGCIETRKDRIEFTHALGVHLKIEDIRKLEPMSSETFTMKDVARCILSNKNVTSILLHDIPTEKVVVDFSSPNIAKPFHVGHLKSTILGSYIANLKQYLGDEIIRINYLGDWGTQFGILSAAFKRVGSEERLKKDPLGHLVDVYVQGNKFLGEDEAFKQQVVDEFARLEAEEKTAKDFWWNVRDLSLKEYFKVYAKLGIKFDLIQGESAYHKDAVNLVKTLSDKKLLVESDGAKGLMINEDTFVMLAKSNGSTMYLTRDICAAISRKKKFNADSIIYVVDDAQTVHFRNLKDCLNILREDDLKIIHVKFHRIRGLSTRKGQIVLLQELLDEAAKRALKQLENTATTKVAKEEWGKTAFDLGLTALFIKTLEPGRLKKGPVFDWESCFSLKGDSGISLQYAHARLCSLLENNKEIEPKFHEDRLDSLLEDPQIQDAILYLARFDECLLRSDTSLESSELIHYLYGLRHVINKAFKVARVKGVETKLAETRLLVFVKLQEAMAEGFRLLGVRPLKKI